MDSFWDFFWLVLSTFFFLAYLIVLFQIIVDLVRDPDLKGGMKAVWMLGLLVVPVLTAVVYLIARGDGMARRQMGAAQSAQQQTEAYIQSVAGGPSPADQISQAKALRDDGTITVAEYERLKAKALA